MSFLYQQYLIPVVLVLIIYLIIVIKQENKFFSFVERFWFKKKSAVFTFSRLFFIAGFTLLALSLLDLRGPEERIKTKVPSKRTIVLIDTSASMLAEDVRPSRLEKAVLLAKHFARKAVGHQISIIAFSEIQKKIVPFTADLDLIDSRLESIKGLKNQYGTSALSVAIQEAILSFGSTGEEEKGNILVLTDGEETAEGIELKIPEGIYIAFVGIGTKNGGRIPLDDKRGMRYGYKHYKGKDVITKLNEEFFDSIVKKHPQTKFWPADTYALPSEEIVAFFEAEFSKGIENQDMVIRPVYMQWLVVPGIILLILSYFMKMFKVFAVLTLLLVHPLGAQEREQEMKRPPLPHKIVEGLEELQQGHLSREQKMGLAYELQKNDHVEEALKLYQEESKNLTPEQKFNYGTALFSSKNFKQGFSEYRNLVEDENVSDELKKKIAQNALLFLKQQQEEKKQQQDKQQKQNKNQQNNSENSSSSQSPSDQSQDQGQSGQPEKNEDPKDNKDQDGEKNQDQDKESEADKDEKKEKDQGNPQDQDNKPLPPRKLPAKLKQLMSDDRKLQMEMIERGTRDMNKRKSNSSKDW